MPSHGPISRYKDMKNDCRESYNKSVEYKKCFDGKWTGIIGIMMIVLFVILIIVYCKTGSTPALAAISLLFLVGAGYAAQDESKRW